MLNLYDSLQKNLGLLVFYLMALFAPSISEGQESDFFGVADLADSLLSENKDSLAKVAIDKLGNLKDDQQGTQFLYYHKLLGDFYLGTSRYSEAVVAYEPLLLILKKEFDKDFSLKLARGINDLGIAYMKVGKFDDAINAHFESQLIYDRYNEPQGGSYNYNNIAIIYTKLKKIDSALLYHQKSLEYAKLASDTLGIGFNYMNMGILYVDNNDPLKSLEHFQAALKVFEENKNERMMNAVNRRLGTYYGRIKDYESALFKFQEVLTYYEKQKSAAGLGGVHVSLAEVLLELDQIDTAFYHIQKGVEYYEPTGYKNGMSKAYHLMGWYYKKKKMYDKSLESYQHSLDFSKGSLHGMTMSTLNGMSEIYLNQGRFNKAIKATLNGLEIANFSASPGNMAESYFNLSRAYNSLGDTKKAFEYLKRHNEEKEKIFDDEQMFQMARTEYQNQLEREEAQRKVEQKQRELVVEQQLTKERWIRYAVITFSILILLIAFFAYRGYLIKKAANKELAEKNERLKELRENEKRLSEETISSKERELATMAMASHEKNSVLNDLNQKISFLENRMDDELKPSLKDMKKTIANSYSLDNSWDTFLHKFENVHPQFFDKLKDENPVLTAEDLKLSAYLKIGMSNKEIANVTHLTLGSVKSKINRLKKKLEMGPEESLRDYMLKYA